VIRDGREVPVPPPSTLDALLLADMARRAEETGAAKVAMDSGP
jgi:hypothetical protein